MWYDNVLLLFSLIGFQSYELLSEMGLLIIITVVIIIVIISITIIIIMFWFGSLGPTQVPCKNECYCMDGFNAITVSKAITIYFSNGRNVLFPQVIYFQWTAKHFATVFSQLLVFFNEQ